MAGVKRQFAVPALVTYIVFLVLQVASMDISVERAVWFGIGGVVVFWLLSKFGFIKRGN